MLTASEQQDFEDFSQEVTWLVNLGFFLCFLSPPLFYYVWKLKQTLPTANLFVCFPLFALRFIYLHTIAIPSYTEINSALVSLQSK